MDTMWILSRLLHLGAVIVAVGGTVFMLGVVGPAARAVLDDAAHDNLRSAVRDRWRRFVHASIAILLLSGLFNAHVAITAGRSGAYLTLFVVKLLAALGVFFLASALVGRSEAFEPMRRAPRRWLGLSVALSAAIVVLAAVMHGMPTPG